MQTFLKFALYLHIFAGFTALVTGLIPMFSKKGGKAHVLWGKVYFWAMFVVALTALIRFQMKMGLIFLAGIAVFSFYNTFTGVRLIHRKNNPEVKLIDWFAAILMVITAGGMLYFGYLAYQQASVFYTVLFTVFGIFTFALALEDLRVFMGKIVIDNTVPVPSRYWFQNHISRMGGSYIATVTAFLVVNNPPYIPGLIVWIAPGIIGGIIIGRTRAFYRKK
ncbi:MAG: DUF2306 domain-containing protein [Bacteroidota bacterium]